jgi:hypothetical protein
MKTNPEEFAADYGKWDGLIKAAWHEDVTDWVAALNPTEIEMLQEARRKIYRERFTAQVMRTLLKVDDAPTTPTLTAKSTLAPNTVYSPYQNSIGVNTATGGGGIGGAGTWVATGTNTVVTDSMLERFEKVWNKYKKEGGK